MAVDRRCNGRARCRPASRQPAERFEFPKTTWARGSASSCTRPAEAAARRRVAAAFRRIAELNRIMSDYLPDSELMRLCKRPVRQTVWSAPTCSLCCTRSGNLTADGRCVRRDGRTRRPALAPGPTDARIADARTHRRGAGLVDYRLMKLDAVDRTVRLEKAGNAARPGRHRQGLRGRSSAEGV